MRLWHYKLLPHLPRQQLLGQHRECCAMRGLGWGRKHSVVDYVWRHPYNMLYGYHWLVMAEMVYRGYRANRLWLSYRYRGKRLGYDHTSFTDPMSPVTDYPEHNDDYLKECIKNLKKKGVKYE